MLFGNDLPKFFCRSLAPYHKNEIAVQKFIGNDSLNDYYLY